MIRQSHADALFVMGATADGERTVRIPGIVSRRLSTAARYAKTEPDAFERG